MINHALLSPSSAYRWLNCTPSPRLESTLPEKTSSYAEEGVLAHSVCEIYAKKYFKKIKTQEYNKILKKLKTSEYWDNEMLKTAETYVEHLAERVMDFQNKPYIDFEVKVDLSKYVPEAFGTCDCIIFGGDTLIITDYKHGKGVPVKAAENPQLKLYALGAIEHYQPIFGGTLKTVEIYIDQPRINSYEHDTHTVDSLIEWGLSIKSTAHKAYIGVGKYNPGDWCRFCRANGICKAQTDQHLNIFNDFKDNIINNTTTLTPDQISIVLEKGKHLISWYKAVENKSLEMALSGIEIPGWKVVEGKSTRIWADQDKALEKLQTAGVDEAIIYDRVPKTLAQLEKLIGKTEFKEMVGDLIIKPQGKPVLVTSDDARDTYNSAVTDFISVASNN